MNLRFFRQTAMVFGIAKVHVCLLQYCRHGGALGGQEYCLSYALLPWSMALLNGECPCLLAEK